MHIFVSVSGLRTRGSWDLFHNPTFSQRYAVILVIICAWVIVFIGCKGWGS